MVLGTKTRITAEEYYALPEYAEHDFIQLIDGEVVIGVAARTKHQTAVGNFHGLCWMFAKQQGGQAFVAPTEVYLDEANIFEPDVLYLSPNSPCVIEEKRIVGAPQLVVEVLSPSSIKHDREIKFRAYEKHGVQEYWIADVLSDSDSLEVWEQREGRFVLRGVYVPGETFESVVLKGLTVNVKDVFAT